jgi:hypothetical protein
MEQEHGVRGVGAFWALPVNSGNLFACEKAMQQNEL